jgi:hypothetical protein
MGESLQMPELVYLKIVADLLVARLRGSVAERGVMTTEAVIITAVLATLALAALAIIVRKVTAKAEAIQLG